MSERDRLWNECQQARLEYDAALTELEKLMLRRFATWDAYAAHVGIPPVAESESDAALVEAGA